MAPNSNLVEPIVNGAPLDGPADCTLACDEGHLTAHKIVLCAHSKYLLDILSKYPNAEHPIIILTELNITDIKILVNYMYTGELVITNDGSPTSLLRAAQILKIDSLTDFDDDEDVEDEDERDDVDEMDDMDADLDGVGGRLGEASPQKLVGGRSPSPQQQYRRQLSPPQYRRAPSSSPSRQHRQRDHHHHNHHNTKGATTTTSHNNNNSIETRERESLNNKIRCHLCNIGLSDVKCLYRHVLTRHLPEKWGYKCEFCDREFSRDDHLMRHYTTKHKNMEFDREKIRETRRLNREMAKNFHDQISTI